MKNTSYDSKTQQISLSLVTKTKGNLTKTIRLDKDSNIVKDSSECKMSSGTIKRYETTIERFCAGLRNVAPNQAIVHGVPPYDEARIVSKAKYDKIRNPESKKPPVITRSLAHIQYPDGPGIGLLDHDAPRDNSVALEDKALRSFSPQQIIDIITEFFPDMGRAAWISTPSTSSCIFDRHGNELRGEGKGFHLYFFPKNAQDIPRFLETLGQRLFLAGYGRVEISRAGSILYRTIIDLSVGSPERLDFVAGAVCESGLEQRLPDPHLHQGELVDTTLLEELTPKETKQLNEIKAALAEKADPSRNVIREEYLEQEAGKLAKATNIDLDQAREVIRARQNHVLQDDDLLFFARNKGRPVTVAEVLDRGKQYHGGSMADPLEPEYDGGSMTKARFFWNNGNPVINSFAHGGIKYTFQRIEDHGELKKQTVSLVDKDGKPKTKGTILVEIGSQHELFHDETGEGYVTVLIDKHKETWPIKSEVFAGCLLDEFFKLTRKGASRAVVSDATDTLRACARVEGEEHRVFRRTALVDGKIYIDMCDPSWRAIEVTPEGWQVLSDHGIKFLRSPNSLPLPDPEPGGSLDELWPFLNVRPEDRPLVAGFLIRALHPEGPYFGLAVNGEQGTGKSTASKIFRHLCDPSTAMLRPPPKDERDFLAGAVNNWCLTYDNMSGMQAWLSDALCRVLTGGSFACRTLYSTAEETAIPLARPVILNGIDDLLTRPDLADRAIALSLQPIDEADRKDEREMWAAFDAAKGRIFGVLLDGLCSALRNIDRVELPYRPRMLDAAKWATAAEEGLGLTAGSFIAAYQQNQKDMVAMSLEASPFVAAILDMVEHQKHWSGSAMELLDILPDYARDEDALWSKAWPKTPAWAGRYLTRYAPALRKIGIGVRMSRDSSGRHIELSWEGSEAIHDNMTVMTVNSKNLTPHGRVRRGENGIREDSLSQKFSKNTVIAVMPSRNHHFHDSNDGNDSKFQKFPSTADQIEDWEVIA